MNIDKNSLIPFYLQIEQQLTEKSARTKSSRATLFRPKPRFVKSMAFQE